MVIIMTNKEAYQMLYEQKKRDEIYPDNPDGQSLAILEMLAEFQSMGVPITCFADIQLGKKIKSDQVAKILLKYYPRMESVPTKETILRKLDAKKYPEIIGYALEEYAKYTPFEKESMSGLQEVISGGKVTQDYLDFLFSLIDTPDEYCAGWMIREKLRKIAPERSRELTYYYCEGLLLLDSLKDFLSYGDPESIERLHRYSELSDEEWTRIKADSPYSLYISFREAMSSYTTAKAIRLEAKRLYKKACRKQADKSCGLRCEP